MLRAEETNEIIHIFCVNKISLDKYYIFINFLSTHPQVFTSLSTLSGNIFEKVFTNTLGTGKSNLYFWLWFIWLNFFITFVIFQSFFTFFLYVLFIFPYIEFKTFYGYISSKITVHKKRKTKMYLQISQDHEKLWYFVSLLIIIMFKRTRQKLFFIYITDK